MDIGIYDCTLRKLEILFLKPILNIERISWGSNTKQMYKIQKLLSMLAITSSKRNGGKSPVVQGWRIHLVGLIPSQGMKTSHKPHGTAISK